MAAQGNICKDDVIAVSIHVVGKDEFEEEVEDHNHHQWVCGL